MAGQVVGIAFQSLAGSDAENIGYLIPTNVIQHFLTDYRCGSAAPVLLVSDKCWLQSRLPDCGCQNLLLKSLAWSIGTPRSLVWDTVSSCAA